MPKREHGESKNSKTKSERTDSQSSLSPQEEQVATERITQLFHESMHRGNTERSSRRRKLSDQTIQELVYPVKATRVTEQISSATDTTILYCRSGMIPQAEVSQQSSLESARTTGEIPALGNNISLFFGQQLYEWLIEHFDEETARQLASDDDKFSIWFYDVLDVIGINEEHRMACQQASIMTEILYTFTFITNYYITGSSIEGTIASGEHHDLDVIQCYEFYPVFEEIEKLVLHRISFLIITDLSTPAGYLKLQLLVNGIPCTSSFNWLEDMQYIRKCCKNDKLERIVLSDMIHIPDETFSMYRKKNKPAITVKNIYGPVIDNNVSYRCRQWPTFAQEWISRNRLFGWPTNSMVQQLSSLGYFVVKKGHPLSPEKDLEWRASFSLQERKLMFSLTDVQHKCYTVLKMFNREIIASNGITAYHWKTCLFYFIEQNSGNIWKKELLCVCIKLCIMQMLKWVKIEVCPNYFIPQENLFHGTLHKNQKLLLENKLQEFVNVGFNCLLNVKASNICEFYRSRESLEDFQRLQLNSKNDFKKALHIIWKKQINNPLFTFNLRILNRYYVDADEEGLPFIEILWSILNRIHDSDTITEHTNKETKSALSLLLPHIYTCLASNIAAIAIQNANPRARDFLLYGCLTFFMKGNLSGKLKFISVLYAIGLYQECEWYLEQLDEEYIKNSPSFCWCRYTDNDEPIPEEYIMSTTQFNVSTCVSFLSSELPITPDALKYEMFRYFGIFVPEDKRANTLCQWHYRAVVDCNIYFFFLKFLIQKELGRFKENENNTNNILHLLHGQNVRHRDVAYNLIAWIYASIFWTPTVLRCSTLSWDIMKWNKNQFNAAKLHALVALYNTWFARKSPCVQFCFQCFFLSQEDLKKCSNCKISTYCSKQCQINNWKLHKPVCVIVKRYHNI